jgi:hypothetical protein
VKGASWHHSGNFRDAFRGRLGVTEFGEPVPEKPVQGFGTGEVARRFELPRVDEQAAAPACASLAGRTSCALRSPVGPLPAREPPDGRVAADGERDHVTDSRARHGEQQYEGWLNVPRSVWLYVNVR